MLQRRRLVLPNVLLWLIVALPSSRLVGQPEFGFSGYFVDFPAFQWSKSRVAQLFKTEERQFANVTRTRLRPSLTLWTDAQLSLDYELSISYHPSTRLFQGETEENKRQVVDLTVRSIDDGRWTVLSFVDRLHFKQGFGFGDMTVGRQRISWGTGRVWNPTDLFNPISPTSFAKIEKNGVDAALVKFHFGRFTDLSLVFNPQRGWNTSNTGFRFRTNAVEFDLSMMAGYFDTRAVFGGDFAGNLFEAGVRGEGIISAMSDDLNESFAKLILGADYQFTSKLYGMIEYHYNGEGGGDKRSYDLIRLAKGEIIHVGRNYVTAHGSYLLHPLLTGSMGWTCNLNDRSWFAALSLGFSASDEVSILLGGQLFLGDEFDEYWYYPHSLYLKADFFF